MTALITVYNSNGLVGRCDANCYNAIKPHCRCVCGGANHGIGRTNAAANTIQNLERMLDALRDAHAALGTIVARTNRAIHDLAEKPLFSDDPRDTDTPFI